MVPSGLAIGRTGPPTVPENGRATTLVGAPAYPESEPDPAPAVGALEFRTGNAEVPDDMGRLVIPIDVFGARLGRGAVDGSIGPTPDSGADARKGAPSSARAE